VLIEGVHHRLPDLSRQDNPQRQHSIYTPPLSEGYQGQSPWLV
jgi:hypothetical protein